MVTLSAIKFMLLKKEEKKSPDEKGFFSPLILSPYPVITCQLTAFSVYRKSYTINYLKWELYIILE